MQDADPAFLEVGQASAGVVEVAQVVAAEGHGHGVEGEVAPAQVLVQGGGRDPRERSRLVVGLAPGGGEVERQPAATHAGGAEALVLAGPAVQALGQGARHRAGVALHGEIEVHGVGAAQQVADGSAHQVHGRETLQRRQQGLHAGQAAHPLAQPCLGRRSHSRTGTPAACIRSLASRTR